MMKQRNINSTIYKYCTGCGLCQSLKKGILEQDEKGFFHPKEGVLSFLKKVCPSNGFQTQNMDEKNIWGRHENVYYGWACDEIIREKGSSGGVITALCWYLIKEGLVDAVIHTCADLKCSTKTTTCISNSYEELIERSGSRYSISSPLSIIGQLDDNKKYVFVGKPCDVDALKNYMKLSSHIQNQIPYLLSFFCMGVPSIDAQKKLLETMGCPENECVSLRYRGDGWPGFTKAVDKSGNVYITDYDSSWGNILGRDLMPMCRFCINGIGETADIASGDAWYLGDDNKPIFYEKKGRNVVFARSNIGQDLLCDAQRKGYIYLEDFADFNEKLPLIQYAQFERRGTMGARINALRVLFKARPKYKRQLLTSYKKTIPFMKRWEFFKGTFRRFL